MLTDPVAVPVGPSATTVVVEGALDRLVDQLFTEALTVLSELMMLARALADLADADALDRSAGCVGLGRAGRLDVLV